MVAKIVTLANPGEDETLCATVEEAKETLAAMIERFKSQGFRVDKQHSRLPTRESQGRDEGGGGDCRPIKRAAVGAREQTSSRPPGAEEESPQGEFGVLEYFVVSPQRVCG